MKHAYQLPTQTYNNTIPTQTFKHHVQHHNHRRHKRTRFQKQREGGRERETKKEILYHQAQTHGENDTLHRLDNLKNQTKVDEHITQHPPIIEPSYLFIFHLSCFAFKTKMASSSSANHNGGDDHAMDFASLLSRGYRPAHLTRIVPKVRSKDFLKKEHHSHHHHHNHHHGEKDDCTTKNCNGDGAIKNNNKDNGEESDDEIAKIFTTAGVSEDRFLEKLERDEKANRLVFQLISKTQAYRNYLTRDDDDDPEEDAAARLEWSTKMMGDDADLKSMIPKLKWVSPLSSALSLSSNIASTNINTKMEHDRTSTVTIEEITEEEEDDDSSSNNNNHRRDEHITQTELNTNGNNNRERMKKKKNPFASSFHQIELGDWESNIEWGGYKEPANNKHNDNNLTNSNTTTTDNNNSNNPKNTATDATSLLQQRRNPFLENLNFDKLISWTGDAEEVLQKANSVPLILELGVAGRSVAKCVLPNHRPTPYSKSDPYQIRLELLDGKGKGTMKGAVRSTAELNRGTLHADKEQMELFVQSRQSKRRQMAKDKTDRVKDALGTMKVLGGGRGRTITSSLMGPGGTERTGRPARSVGGSQHEFEYVEQLDMVTNHALVKNPSTVMLREIYRPKLPGTVVRTSLSWQFCIRYQGSSSSVDKQKKPETNNASSYSSMMMGTYAGAVSKTKLRTEADLSPTEGNLVLLEYSEERPPLQLTKAMASKIVTYYRGDKSRCPVSRVS